MTMKKPVRRVSTKKEKRIAILKDALAKLKKRKFITGIYIRKGWQTIKDFDVRDELQKHVVTMEKNCEVCMLGNLFLSQVYLYNDFNVGNYNDDMARNDIFLSRYFSEKQLDLIEAAFETKDIFLDMTPQITKAIEFGKKYRRDRQRAKAILENMLENDGMFVPFK